ncbi:formyltransferase [Desulfurella sp.]|uniref:formyltransferase n=1 Tax=Desulfurella sp. TaxID=1962857 RepID=UPI0025C6F6DF|nr:formyltransferase [Desulfurella sp.]
MKTVVFAYHNMGVIGCSALKKHRFDIKCVFTHKNDKNENIWFESVQDWCKKNNIEYFAPENVNTKEWIDKIASYKPDIIFSFYYRNLICEDILRIPPFKAINLHGSCLPAYRGRAPVNWVLVNGEKQTGVTLHYMVKKPDAGDIIAQKCIDIDFYDTAKTLYEKLEKLAFTLLDETLPHIKNNTVKPVKQDESKASYFGRRTKQDGLIDFNKTAIEIYNLIRAVTKPYPGAFCYYKGKELIIWWAIPSSIQLPPKQIIKIDNKVYIGAKKGSLELKEVEYDGKTYKEQEILNLLEGGYL